MEDRHRISEPRPVKNNGGSMLSWEVDILRDETVIVDTFWLNNEVLPPRTNKKGKVVWRLPDKADKLPSFGTDDRRRILDIFKERKKKRKQEKKKRGDHSPPQSGEPGTGKCGRRDSSTTSPGVKGGGDGGDTEPETYYEMRDSGNKAPGEVESNGTGSNVKHKGKENGKSSENLSKERDVRDYTEIDKGQKQKKKAVQVERGRGVHRASSNGSQHSQPSLTPIPTPPPGLRASPIQASSQGTNSSTLPASGQHQSQSHSTQLQPQVPSTPDPSRMSLDDSKETSTSPQQQTAQKRPLLPAQTSFIQPLSIDALFITVPRHERSESLPGHPETSLAVPAARHFISKYYSHFNGSLPGAQIGDLIRYYTTKAQKSVSIGGAHSVVTGRRDIAAQILNLAGAAFVVRGVVAQDAADGKGVHILVTGTARTGLNGAPGGVLANFAHSISLVPIDDGVSREIYRNDEHRRGDGSSCPALFEALKLGFPFQIHNDALALLSGDAGPVTPTPIPQPTQMPQQRPPPPGLF